MPDIIRPDFSRFGKLLLLRTDRIGDLLVSTPCIRALRQALPDTRLELVASALNAPAVAGNPHLDAVHVFHPRRPWTWPALARRLRNAAFDATLVLNSNSRSACALARLVGSPQRIGFSGLPTNKGRVLTAYARVYTWIAEGGSAENIILNMLERMERLGIAAPSPHLDFTVPSITAETVRARFPLRPDRLRLAVFVGNIKKVQNRWPVEKFRELVLHLLSTETDLEIVILAGPPDRPLLSAFTDIDHPRLTRFVGETLQESGALLSTCSGLVAGSSGPTHVAAALDVPILAVVTRHNATVWRTLGPRDRAVTPNDDARDMRGIPVEPVEAMIRAFLTEERERLGLSSHAGHVADNNNS